MLFQKSSFSNDIIIVGCGFLGKAAALLFSSQGYSVLGIVRNPLPPSASSENISFLRGDVTDPASIQALTPQIPLGARLIYCVSSGKGGSQAYGPIYREGLRHVLEAWQPKRPIFVSSTSVYAQVNGEIVTETSLADPDRETGRILLEAEGIALKAGGMVARFSGIYGPGRSVLLRKFIEGSARLEEGGTRLINQIHRDDGARALFHLATSSTPSGIYNVSDNMPATQREVYQWIADSLGKPLPPTGPADYNRKRGWTSKRISNEKLRITGWTPLFPSYREALPTLLETEDERLKAKGKP